MWKYDAASVFSEDTVCGGESDITRTETKNKCRYPVFDLKHTTF